MPARFLLELWSQLFPDVLRQELSWLWLAGRHDALLARRRAQLIGARVRLLAALFALALPLWVLVDVVTLPQKGWLALAATRLVACAGFSAIALVFATVATPARARTALAALIALMGAYYLASVLVLGQFQLSGVSAIFVIGYGFMPYAMVASLALLPLAAGEYLAAFAAVALVHLLAGLVRAGQFEWLAFGVEFWLIALVGVFAGLAAMSHLATLVAQVRAALRDAATGCFTRQSGEEILAGQFANARRSGAPLALALIRPDRPGVDAGRDAGEADRVLALVAGALARNLRTEDVVARWGADRFAVLMPTTHLERAIEAMERLRVSDLGAAGDGRPIRISIGLAERSADAIADTENLLAAAERRLREAGMRGGDCCVSKG